jgi:UDP-N-acetylmuramate--alanine ligase
MFGRIKKLYFVGIGGAGMSGIAEILKVLGYNVKGSDLVPSEVTRHLESLGVEVVAEHAAANISDCDVVVISSAVGENNPEVVEARRLGIPVIKRAEMLGELMRLKFSIGISGTHGKTTTTSMIARIFRSAKLQPTIIVGGVVREMGTGATLGEGDYLITEVDEYDRSIEAMFPTVAVVLNIEQDHLDCYADMDDLRRAFLSYMNRVPFFGSAIISADDPNIQLVKNEIARPYVTFGFSVDADYRAVEVEESEWGASFSVFWRGDLLGRATIKIPGLHNVMNALAALAVANELEVPFEVATESLNQFSGVERRFELLGEVNGVLVMDDYAHHPTEVRATLAAASKLKRSRIITIYQPHLFSRTQAFAKEFAEALSASDHVLLSDIYPAREEPIPGVTSQLIADEAARKGYTNFECVGTKDHAVAALMKIVQHGDLVIIMGAGSITHIQDELLEALKGL